MASFDENGKYIKTNWKAGDKITATKLNKIEESIEAVNDNDISRHVEADTRLDALEAKDVAHDKEFTNVKNTIADNKAAAELGDYKINSRMTFLEEELNEGIEEVHNVAETVDGKIAQGKADMEAMVAEVESEMIELQNDVSEIQNDMAEYLPLSGGTITGDLSANCFESTKTVESADGGGTIGTITNSQLFIDQYGQGRFKVENNSGNTPFICIANPHDCSLMVNGSIKPAGGFDCNLGSFDDKWGHVFAKGEYVSDVSDGEKHFGFYTADNLVSYMYGKADGTIGMYDKLQEKNIYHYNSSDWILNTNAIPKQNDAFNLGSENNRWNIIYSTPFTMHVEDNGFTSRLKANRGNFRLVDGYGASVLSWSHDYSQIGPDATNVINLGSADFRYKSLYLNAQPNVSSDRTLKENIQYVNSNESNVSYEDMYAFVKDDLELATYNLVDHDKLNMGFIAQDLLVNLDGTDNKVGQMIVNPVAVPTEEEIEEGKPYPTLSYDTGMYTSVLAGALKEAINKIEQLEARINELENK